MDDSPEPSAKQPAKARRYKMLFVRGNGQRRRKLVLNKVTASAKASAKGPGKTKGTSQKTKKTAFKQAKKAPAHVPEVVANYKKQPGGLGSLLIEQQMRKAKHLDDTKFASNLLFDADSECCRLQIEKCKDVPWSVVLGKAHDYFRTVFLACSKRMLDTHQFRFLSPKCSTLHF